MKRFLSILSLLVCSALVCAGQYRTRDYSDLTDSETVRAMRAHVGFLASAALEGRAAGSEGELEAADYVTGSNDEDGVAAFLSALLNGCPGEDRIHD